MLRHASAGTGTTDTEVDRKRPLDKEGVRHCLQLAQVLNSMKIGFDLIVSSPPKRSLQTATLVATETRYKSRVLQSDSLVPEADLKDSGSFSISIATGTASWWWDITRA
jgi:phosphohistidine phosphatase